MTDKLPNRSWSLGTMLAILLSLPAAAQAHVKWFCGPIDRALPPVPLREIVTPIFLIALAAFATLILVGALLDAMLARVAIVRPKRAEVVCDVIVRIGLAAYAICLWRGLALVMWAAPPDDSILTPDLYGSNALVGYLQLAIAVAVLIPRLSLFAAAGLLTLYVLGISQFGGFYMIDYLFFPGLAAYVALGDPRLASHARLHRWRVPLLVGSLSLSLMWTAVEKFLFPQWTIAVLLHHPGVTAGYPLATVATIAGFVEFSLAFYLLAGREILGRIGAILLMIVFVAAMPEFGMLDVVGHIPVLVILLVAFVTGETPLQVAFRRNHTAMIGSALNIGQGYLVVMMILVGLYYGLHAASVRI